MDDELPSGDRAVYVFLEILAFCFALASVDALVLGKWRAAGIYLLVALIFFLAGIKWPQIRNMAGEQVSHIVERLASYRALAIVTAVTWICIFRPEIRYRYAALGIGASYFFLSGLNYMRAIRRDLETYVMPREVTSRQSRRLSNYLSNQPVFPIIVKVDPHDQEALRYASQLVDALKRAKWDAAMDISPPYSPNDGLGIDATGVNTIAYGAKNDSRPLLSNGLRFAGIAVNRGGGTGAGEFKVSLSVGKRPLVLGSREPFLARLGRQISSLGYQRFNR